MAKKLLLIFLFILLVGCNDTVISKKPYILFATPLDNHPVWSEAGDGFFAGCIDFDMNCEWKGPETIDTQAMETIIYEGIMKKADGIITQGVVSPEILQLAAQHNIPVILVDSDVSNAPRNAIMKKNFSDQAQIMVKDMMNILPDTHYIIGIQVAELSFDIAPEQINALELALEESNASYEIIKISESKSDQLLANKEWYNTLVEYPTINVLINFAGESASEASKVVDILYPNNNRPIIYGVDEVATTLEDIKHNKIRGTIVTSFYNYGYDSVKLLKSYIEEGTSIPEVNYVDISLLVEVD